MENWKELVYQSVSTVIFCIAVVLLLHQYASYTKLLEQLKYRNQSLLYQQYKNEADPLISYAELIATLVQPLEYDMEIDEVLISKYEHTPDQIQSYGIKKTNYVKSYAYDGNGEVTRILYKSIGP